MADPTLKDVLDAIASLDGRIANVEAQVANVEGRMATKDDLRAVREELRGDILSLSADVANHRRETAKGFVDLDRELAAHSDPVHRKLEDEMAALRKLVTAKKTVRPVTRRPRRA